MSDSSGVSTHAYDPLGRIVSYTAPQSGVNLTCTYDQVGNRLHLGETGGAPGVTYVYDPVGNLVQITNTNSEITSYTYDPLRREVQKYTPAYGVLTAHAFDAGGRETSRLVKTGSAVTAAYTATYDSVGNRLTVG